MGNGFYVLRFTNQVDYERVLLGGPWLVSNQHLTIQLWTLVFDWEHESIKRVVV